MCMGANTRMRERFECQHVRNNGNCSAPPYAVDLDEEMNKLVISNGEQRELSECSTHNENGLQDIASSLTTT